MIMTLILLSIVASIWITVSILPALTTGIATRTVAALQRYFDADQNVLARMVPQNWTSRLLEIPLVALLAVPLILGTWLFFGILDEVAEGNRLIDLDRWVFEFFRARRNAPLDSLMITVTSLGDARVVMPVTLAGLATLIAYKRWRPALYLTMATAGAAIFVGGVKHFIQRPRPISIYDGIAEYSFPSGHASMSVVLFGFLAVLLAQGAPLAWRRVIAFAALLLILMISFSRVYLGAHWLSDVAAGLGFGVAWVALLTIMYWRHVTTPAPPAAFAAVLLSVFAIAATVHIVRDAPVEKSRYAIPAGFQLAPR
jgi:membrane-associated phospholipid phosphatase